MADDARGSGENKALFGDPAEKKLGEWGEASKEFATLSNGSTVVFPDMNRLPEQLQRTAFFNAELPAAARTAVPSTYSSRTSLLVVQP